MEAIIWFVCAHLVLNLWRYDNNQDWQRRSYATSLFISSFRPSDSMDGFEISKQVYSTYTSYYQAKTKLWSTNCEVDQTSQCVGWCFAELRFPTESAHCSIGNSEWVLPIRYPIQMVERVVNRRLVFRNKSSRWCRYLFLTPLISFNLYECPFEP